MKIVPGMEKKAKKVEKVEKELDNIALVIKQKSIANYASRRRNITVYTNVN